jgi:cytidylate kinase
MKEQVREDPVILAAAERQMNAWAMLRQLRNRAAARMPAAGPAAAALRCIAISREAGTGGSEIAQQLGGRLGWRVFDKNLLDQVAARYHLPRTMLDLVDETATNWAYDVLGTWMDHKLVPHEKYLAYLSRVVQLVGRSGPAVFVGRGSQFLLPRQEVLAVRLIASPKYRVGRLMERMGLSHADAERKMAEIDRGRQAFVRQSFHHDTADPHLYDLVVNVERFGADGAVGQILTAVGTPAATAGRR